MATSLCSQHVPDMPVSLRAKPRYMKIQGGIVQKEFGSVLAKILQLDLDSMAPRASSRSRSPVLRRRTRRDEFESPHGHGRKEHSLDLPTSFQSDSKYLDRNTCFGRQLYRNVCSTPWSNQVGIANRAVESIKVHELCYLGWQNHNFRALSAGAFVSVVFARSVREAQLVESLLRLCRTEHVDVESAAFNRWFQKYGDTPTDKDTKNKAVQELANEALDAFRPFRVSTEARDREIVELRQKVQQHEAEKGGEPSKRKAVPSKSPDHRPRRSLRKSQGDDAKSLPIQSETSSPLLVKEPEVKPLRDNYPSTVTTQGVNAWIRKMPKKQQANIQAAIKEAEKVFKELTDAQVASLPDVAAGWGLVSSRQLRQRRGSLFA